jgi:hypothetical protein
LRPQPNVGTRRLAAASVLGLLLAIIGLYGTMAFVVATRTSEIGVRMAIGATATQILSGVHLRRDRDASYRGRSRRVLRSRETRVCRGPDGRVAVLVTLDVMLVRVISKTLPSVRA